MRVGVITRGKYGSRLIDANQLIEMNKTNGEYAFI